MDEHVPELERPVGVITHYWSHLGVAGVHLLEPLDVGDHIHVLGHTTDLEQEIESMQIDNNEVRHANSGDDVGIRVGDHVREHDAIYKRTSVADLGAGEHAL